MAAKKILSLLPAATEIVCALGLQDQLVGRSHECDYPPEVRQLPVCSEARFLPGDDSAAIDRQVRQILSDALSVYTVNEELIRQLNPDVIITQTQCEVCAVSERDVEDALKDVLGKEAEIISLSPSLLSDIFTEIRAVAAKLEVPDRGDELLGEINGRIDIIRHKLKYTERKPSVACIEWLSPLMTAGNWTPEIVGIAGGEPVLAAAGEHSSYTGFNSIRAADPELILIIPCGFSIMRTMKEMHLLLDLPGWNELDAVKNNRVFIADGNQYFNRSGTRIIDSIEILAEIIHPKLFAFGYEGTGWIKFVN